MRKKEWEARHGWQQSNPSKTCCPNSGIATAAIQLADRRTALYPRPRATKRRNRRPPEHRRQARFLMSSIVTQAGAGTAALTGWQSDKRTPIGPPECHNCRWVGGRVLEAMRGRGLFVGQAGKHREDFAFKQNGLHGKSRVQLRPQFRGETFALCDYRGIHAAALRAL
jgi:hypothetical protein